MSSLRRLLAANRPLACLVLAAALLVKALVPAGYMIVAGQDSVLISVCSDATGAHTVKQVVVPVKGQSTDAHEAAKKQCPFSGFNSHALADSDPALLALAILFALALGFAASPPLRIAGVERLRPPLRGPPAAA